MININTLLFFILIYATEGIISLFSQPLYYLMREHWKLTATTIGLIGVITSIAWYIKPLFGIIIDYFPIKRYRCKNYLFINSSLMIVTLLYILIFGLNIITLIVTITLINICVAFNDVANDTQMVILEQKYNLKGKIQAIQWTSLGLVGLGVSILGAYLSDHFSVHSSYKVASVIILAFPLVTIWYLIKRYSEKKVVKRKKLRKLKLELKVFQNKPFMLGLLFIICLQFSPSFGTALMIKMRESMHIGKMFIGYLGATGTILGLVGYIIYYWRAHKFKMKNLLYFTIIFTTVSNLFYLYIPNKWFLLGYNILFGAFGGITFLTILAYMASIVPKTSEGLFYALVTGVSNLAGRLGVAFGGILYDKFGYNTNVIVSSICTLLCLVFIPYLNLKNE